MMKGRLFIFFDKLQINKGERIAVTGLSVCLLLLGSVNFVFDQEPIYDVDHYREMEQIFHERSQRVDAEKNSILARYEGIDRAVLSVQLQQADTVTADTDSVKVEPEDEDESDKININSAGLDALERLPGIGPVYAQRIVNWRNRNGKFTTARQLLEIRGIGEKRLEKLKPLVQF